MKAVKNKVELAGARAAHVRDGAAMARFLAWFDREAPKGSLTEIAAAQALETFRRETGALKDISFPTISAAGPHAAIPHYRVSEASNLQDRPRTLPRSTAAANTRTAPPTSRARSPSAGRAPKMRDRFTRVLKGHIAIARAVFPKGTSGAQIDAFARAGALARRARFRPRHGPRRRLVSLRPRRPAAHRQDRNGRAARPA